MRTYFSILIITSCVLAMLSVSAQPRQLDQYNTVWNTPSENASESMPCGGGDIGLNVWSEDGDVLFYLSKSGTFDESNTFLKLGRVRLKLNPNPFDGSVFKQELHLKDGYVSLSARKGDVSADVKIWVDVVRPVIHVEVNASQKINAQAHYESWRYQNRFLRKLENFQNSYKWVNPEGVKTYADQILFTDGGVQFMHQNNSETVFDVTVKQQGMEAVKDSLYNPIAGLTFGGFMTGENMIAAGNENGRYQNTNFKSWVLESKRASKSHEIEIFLTTADSRSEWRSKMDQLQKEARDNRKTAFENTTAWWQQFWERSFVFINSDDAAEKDTVWQVGRNYQLFRYMLGCNAYGNYPTKFNGGLFTVDPVFTDSTRAFTPDFRNWGGGTFTAQNQRLVYFPMLKSGDFELMKPQFDFYKRLLHNATLRSQFYWGHEGACFTEQIENFGLPNGSEYNWDRPEDYPKGRQYNAWLEYQYDTSLEFCFMILETARYNGNEISEYLPLIKSCLTFFDEHYRYLATQRGRQTLDGNGHLVLYPGSACETYKMAYNSTTTVAALKIVLEHLIALPNRYDGQIDRERWKAMLDRVPPISFTEHEGHQTIAPAKLWERVNNTEVPQLYPVYPWGMYGVGKANLEVAINTWKYDPDAIKFRSHVGWKQDVIFAARMGLNDEAADLCIAKMKDSGRRFPAFWGPGFDWVPDHNWGGSGMIGVQEMLMQTVDDKIYLFPSWPKEWDVHFKLHAPDQTTIEVVLKKGEIESLKVFPESRTEDVVNCYETNK
ncbi:DUF5703 domain-containing protein [uncultured Sunxiuqinia sp.]|uniref:DUF5703 domain-containing protein n=1 Tax=uncultured Sunxiuqinia sp. TaxID=1573825 RepID=UPI002AA84BD3|nr:DUF5703 domain-containing protein [uncultured Sunxiuqinia sp.]